MLVVKDFIFNQQEGFYLISTQKLEEIELGITIDHHHLQQR